MGLSIDREKVIKGLENIHAVALDKEQLYVNHMSMKDFNELLADALALLKEQEPKLVRIDEDSVHCPSCGNELFTYPRQKFCDECGQAVKWE